MGEDTKEYDGGEVVSTEGSWEAGVDGALPGILMPATFAVGQMFQQEYYEGVAEDMGQLVRSARPIDRGRHGVPRRRRVQRSGTRSNRTPVTRRSTTRRVSV